MIAVTGTKVIRFRPVNINKATSVPEIAPPKAPERFISESLRP
jgi:hypothetical protein